ncbi:hypothetical protein [Streptomyces cyaneofuscatus]
MVLLPSVMLLLGERNWRTPRGLSRLPGLEGDERDRTAGATPVTEKV